MHRLATEGGEKPECHQVEITVDKPVPTHKLRFSVFARLMVDTLLAYLVEPRILCEIRDVAVHLSIYLDILHNLFPISLQSAVEIMKVMYARHLAGRGIEELRGYGLGQRIALAAVHLVAADKVITVIHYHAVKLGNLVGRILKVGIHGNHNISLSLLKTTEEGGRLAVVAPELYAMHFIML